jgi:hypothetical protein
MGSRSSGTGEAAKVGECIGVREGYERAWVTSHDYCSLRSASGHLDRMDRMDLMDPEGEALQRAA